MAPVTIFRVRICEEGAGRPSAVLAERRVTHLGQGQRRRAMSEQGVKGPTLTSSSLRTIRETRGSGASRDPALVALSRLGGPQQNLTSSLGGGQMPSREPNDASIPLRTVEVRVGESHGSGTTAHHEPRRQARPPKPPPVTSGSITAPIVHDASIMRLSFKRNPHPQTRSWSSPKWQPRHQHA